VTYGLSNGHLKGQTHDHNTLRAQYLANSWEMVYGLSNSHVTDDVTLPPKVLWGSTVGYSSNSLASCC